MLEITTMPGYERLSNVVAYLHTAKRLMDCRKSPSEFLAEVIIQYCKILDVLFLIDSSHGSAESARIGLEEMGYNEEIEKYFIPAIYLRNQSGAAHINIARFSASDRRAIQEYCKGALYHFSKLVEKCLSESPERFRLDRPVEIRKELRRTIDAIHVNFGSQQ
ncbi:MAG: hypothetical protein RIG82_13650 [Phycisphaeraceae bacterium]